MEQHKEEIEAAGLRVVAIGLGQPKHARRFCTRLAPSITCLTNEKSRLHRTYGLERSGRFSALRPGVLAAAARAGARGHMQGTATGDMAIKPGTFIVDQAGIIQAAHFSAHSGDHPDLPELITEFQGREK